MRHTGLKPWVPHNYQLLLSNILPWELKVQMNWNVAVTAGHCIEKTALSQNIRYYKNHNENYVWRGISQQSFPEGCLA